MTESPISNLEEVINALKTEAKNRKSIKKLKEFAHTKEGNVVLEYDLVKRFFEIHLLII